MIKAIAIDDEPLALEVIKDYAARIDFLTLEITFTKTAEAKTYIDSNDIDLLFLDIEMPKMSGIDFFKSFDKKIMVIFTTAYSEYAVEGFNLSAIDYLLKPFDFDRFRQAVAKAKDFQEYLLSREDRQQKELFFQADYGLQKIKIDDIIYIEGMADYLRIHLSEQRPVVIRMTMKEINNQLPSHLMRIHRSYIISIPKIKSIRNRKVVIDQKELPIGKTYIKEFKDRFMD